MVDKSTFKKIFIPDDASPELKEILKMNQRALNNIQEMKAKSAAGTFAMADLKALPGHSRPPWAATPDRVW